MSFSDTTAQWHARMRQWLMLSYEVLRDPRYSLMEFEDIPWPNQNLTIPVLRRTGAEPLPHQPMYVRKDALWKRHKYNMPRKRCLCPVLVPNIQHGIICVFCGKNHDLQENG